MSIVFRDPNMPINPPGPPWPTFQTFKTAQCLVSNLFLEKYGAGRPLTLLLNAPLRVWSCVQVYKKDERTFEDYRDVAFDVASVVALFFPKGRKFSMVLDAVAEFTRIWFKPTEPKKKSGIQFREPLDCTVYENALKCLGLTEEEARDKDVLERRYQATYTHEKERRDWFREKKHGPLLKFAEMKLHEKHVSYRTILARHHNEM